MKIERTLEAILQLLSAIFFKITFFIYSLNKNIIISFNRLSATVDWSKIDFFKLSPVLRGRSVLKKSVEIQNCNCHLLSGWFVPVAGLHYSSRGSRQAPLAYGEGTDISLR